MAEEPGTSSPSPQENPYSVNHPIGNNQNFPVIYPGLLATAMANSEPGNRGAGVYAVPIVNPFFGSSLAMPPNDLIPLTFNIPTRPTAEAGTPNDQGNGAQQPQQQGEAGPQRQAMRRFQIAFQIDLMLIIKLAAVIVLFNQDGSRQRLVVLLICAVIVYLYQTGALAPLIRWLTDSMQVAAAPRRPQPALRPENVPLIQRQNNNAPGGEPLAPEGRVAEAGDEHHPEEEEHQRHEDGNLHGGGADNGDHQRWGFVREIQVIVFGFITSLLPGFHNAD